MRQFAAEVQGMRTCFQHCSRVPQLRSGTVAACSKHMKQAAQVQAASGAPALPKGLPGVPNARDLAETYPGLRPGLLMRCANPAGATSEATALVLDKLGVRHMIDLRSAEEAAEDPPGCQLMARTRLQRYRRVYTSAVSWRMQVQPAPDDNYASPSSHNDARHTSTSATTSNPSSPAQQPPLPSPLSSGPQSSSAHQHAHQQPHEQQHSSHQQLSSTTNGHTRSKPHAAVMRHQLSLLERGRYYVALAQKIPLSTTVMAVASAFVSREAARRRLLVHVNAGGLGLLYRILLDSAQPEIAAVMEVVTRAVSEGSPVLFFCKAGKDRTGLMAALLLAVAGATPEQIVEDYHRSDAYHAVALAGLEKKSELAGLDRKAFERAPKEAMRDALQYLQDKYGGPAAYLTYIGFGPERQKVLRRAILQQPGRPVM